jgi:hypothetical protein
MVAPLVGGFLRRVTVAQRRQRASLKPRSGSPSATVQRLRRLLKEERQQRREALEQQSATAEILQGHRKPPRRTCSRYAQRGAAKRQRSVAPTQIS